MKKIILAISITALTSGCTSVAQHKEQLNNSNSERITVGTAQREIKEGMSGAEVAAVLGSPNIVSTDEKQREVWVYDKISTEHAYSTSSGGVSALILGVFGAAGAGGIGGVNQSSGAATNSQKTLTIIIKFDKQKKVRDFAYHTSRF